MTTMRQSGSVFFNRSCVSGGTMRLPPPMT